MERLRQSTNRKLRLQPLKRENYLDKYILNREGTQRYMELLIWSTVTLTQILNICSIAIVFIK